jgi:hypothetical protein
MLPVRRFQPGMPGEAIDHQRIKNLGGEKTSSGRMELQCDFERVMRHVSFVFLRSRERVRQR